MDTQLDFGQIPAQGSADVLPMLVAGLQLSAVLRELADGQLALLAAKAHLKDLDDGDVLCHQNDVAHTVWLVLDGWVKLTRETLDGDEAVWDVLGQGHMVGLDTLTAPYQYTTRAVAVGKGSALAIAHSALRHLLEKEPKFALLLLNHALKQQQDERLDMEHRTHQTAPQRIGCFLLQLAGTPKGGEVVLHLPFDKGLLAARLGMQPETFSRALAKLKTETGMAMEGVKVRMDVAKMTGYICGNCSGIYPCR